MTASRNSLPPGYKLHWYLIKDVLGQGGFGITYLAEDTNLNHLVAIKEFLPVEMAVREGDSSIHPVSSEQGENFQWGLERFISEAQTLARFRHDNIVRVFTVFSENNTAYMIMEYEKGRGLHEILKTKGRLSEQEALDIMLPVLDGLERVHAAGFIHRDIKPPNIFIREDGSPVLLDFGSARQSLGEHTRTLTTIVSPGYAPFEQYVSKSDKQGPWTDIYGLGATMYRAITGVSPPNAVDRSEAILHTGKDIYVPAVDICDEGYSELLLHAIDHAMAFKADDRPQDIVAWRGEMTGAIDLGLDEDETELLPEVQAEVPAKTEEAKTVRIAEAAVPEGGEANVERTVKSPEPKWASGYIRFIKRLIWVTVIVTGIIVVLNLKGKREDTVTSPETPAPATDFVEPIPAKPEVSRSTGNRSGSSNLPSKDAQSETSRTTTSPEKKTTPSASRPSVQASSTETQKPPDLISSSDRRRLATLRERLRTNPKDTTSQRQLRRMLNDYNTRVKEALKEGDLARADAYLSQLLELTPNNRKLQQALDKIREARANEQ